MTLTTLVPYAARAELARARRTARVDAHDRRGRERFPGLRESVRFAEGGTPRTLERYTRNSDGAIYGWALAPDQIGPGRPANETPLPGLWLAGHWAQPGGGVYGVVTSGVNAARGILGARATPSCSRASSGGA